MTNDGMTNENGSSRLAHSTFVIRKFVIPLPASARLANISTWEPIILPEIGPSWQGPVTPQCMCELRLNWPVLARLGVDAEKSARNRPSVPRPPSRRPPAWNDRQSRPVLVFQRPPL